MTHFRLLESLVDILGVSTIYFLIIVIRDPISLDLEELTLIADFFSLEHTQVEFS